MQPAGGHGRDVGGTRGARGQRRAARARLLVAARAGRGRAARGRRRAEDPRGRRRRARSRSAPRSTSPTATTSSSRSTPTGSTRRSRWRTRSRRSAAARSTRSTSRAAAAATRPTCSNARRPRAHPHLVDVADRAVRRRTRRPSTSRWSPPSTCSRRARAPATGPRCAHRVRPRTMAAEGVLHDLGVIAMLSSDSQGMGRVGEVVPPRVPERRRDEGAARGAEPGPGDNERVLRHLAKVTINPAIAHGLAAHVGSLEVGKLADAVLWRPQLFGVRPELVVKAGMPPGAPRATATRRRCSPSRCPCAARSGRRGRRRRGCRWRSGPRRDGGGAAD